MKRVGIRRTGTFLKWIIPLNYILILFKLMKSVIILVSEFEVVRGQKIERTNVEKM